ncbi:MAG: tetratricopeptide repeat protein [Spirochaetales bacterium]|jgi:tetratricopeptide (TPR) repeat protein|nr:tetratricopeptide repeat protein [Spirochaetales bacterium]
MFCIALEISGCKQLEKTEAVFFDNLLKAIDARAQPRGGHRTRVDDDYFVIFFETPDAADAPLIMDAACDVGDILGKAQDYVVGFLLLIEFFPDSIQKDAVCRELRGITSLHEIDDSLLAGPRSADLVRPYCTGENSGGCLRIKERIQESGLNLETAAGFCVRPPIVGEIQEKLAAYLDCVKAPGIFLVYGNVFSGIRYQLDCALEALGIPFACRIFPVPGRTLPLMEIPGFEDIPQVLQHTEKKLWQEKKNIFSYRGRMDFPFEEAFSAFSLAITAYIRLCERKLIPAVLVCEEFQDMPEAAGKILSSILRRNLPGWKLLPVCLSRKASLGEAFKKLPIETYEIPPVTTDEIRSRVRALTGEKTTAGLVSSRNAQGGIVSLYFGFLARNADHQKAKEGQESARDFQPLMRFLRTQERPLREILYVIQEASGLIPPHRLGDFFSRLDFTPAQCTDIINRLARRGFIRDTKSLLPVFPELRRFLRKDSGMRKTKISGMLADFFYALWKEKDFEGDYLLLDFFAENGCGPYLVEVFHSYVNSLLDMGNTAEAQKLLEMKFPVLLSADMKLVLSCARLRLALALEDEQAVAEAFLRLDSTQDSPYYGTSLIQKTFYWLKRGDRKEALNSAKNAVILFQGKPDADELAEAYNAVGLAMLAAGNPEHAIDYFLMSREQETPNSRSLFLEGICRFVIGNYTRAQGNFAQAAAFSDKRYARRWAMSARFMEGRILFELGEYEQAGTVFQLLLSDVANFQYRAPVPVVYAWLARTLAYQGDTRMAACILDKFKACPEAVFFRAEADYFQEEYRKARDRLQPFLDFPYTGDFFPGNTPAWKDGFYFAENICVGNSGGTFLLRNLIRFFHAYLYGLGSESSQGAELMSHLIRDEKPLRNDPFIGLYYYWYFKVLPEKQNPAFEDRLTVLGRATQNLQSRMSRMDSSVHKRSFTGKNYWNRLLLADARQNNLM